MRCVPSPREIPVCRHLELPCWWLIHRALGCWGCAAILPRVVPITAGSLGTGVVVLCWSQGRHRPAAKGLCLHLHPQPSCSEQRGGCGVNNADVCFCQAFPTTALDSLQDQIFLLPIPQGQCSSEESAQLVTGRVPARVQGLGPLPRAWHWPCWELEQVPALAIAERLRCRRLCRDPRSSAGSPASSWK